MSEEHSLADQIDDLRTRLSITEAVKIVQTGEIKKLLSALEPFTKLGGPNDGVMPAYHDLPDDVVIYHNSGECITAGDVRAARNAFGILHAPYRSNENPSTNV